MGRALPACESWWVSTFTTPCEPRHPPLARWAHYASAQPNATELTVVDTGVKGQWRGGSLVVRIMVKHYKNDKKAICKQIYGH